MRPRDHRRRPGEETASEKATGLEDPKTSPSYGDGLTTAIDNAVRDWWFVGASAAIRQLALAGRGFTADHLLDLVGEPTDPHYVGAAFAAARRSNIIEPVGCRVGRGGRLVRVWWGVPS